MAFDPYSEFFTPQEFPVEILNIAKHHDVIPCCLPLPAKNFLAFMLFKEYYYGSNGLSIYISDHPETTNDDKPQVELSLPTTSSFPFAALFAIPTITLSCAKDYERSKRRNSQSAVLVCTRRAFLDLTVEESPYFDPKLVTDLNLLVISNVHEALTSMEVQSDLGTILKRLRHWNLNRDTAIRTVFLTTSLLHFYGHEAQGFWRMEETFRKLEKFCGAKVDTTSDIVALLRYSVPPTERIVLVGPHLRSEFSVKVICEVKKIIEDFKRFLNSHNYNPAASLGYNLNEFQELIKEKPPGIVELESLEDDEDLDTDSLAEELRKIPHPNMAPLAVLCEFEEILDKMGPWCASRAIFLLNNKLAGMKVQVPYVRHFLLLGALHTRLLWIQGIFHAAFDELEPLEVLEKFSTPKLMSVLSILRRFELTKPHDFKGQTVVGSSATAEIDLDDDNSEVELTVADYLEQQKQAEQQAASRGRFHGRRKHFRGGERDRQKRKGDADSGTPVSTVDNPELATPDGNPKRPSRPRRTRFAQRSEDTLCGLLICEDRNSARLLYHFLNEASEADPKLLGLSPVLTVPSNPEYDPESPETEVEHKKREESLRKFRYREANFLIGTALLEDLIELPKANLVIRFDEASSFRSHLLSKGRAQGFDPEYYIFTDNSDQTDCLKQLATYKIVEEILLANTILPSRTSMLDTVQDEDNALKNFPHYKSVSLTNSVSIINRYCARLPSDTFTRLAPSWSLTTNQGPSGTSFSCSLRLPINSPVKWLFQGFPMLTGKLAKKAVALQAVIALHKNGELDENLLPIGKEGVSPVKDLEIGEELGEEVYGEFRPGSTRRRQYYDKQLSPELLHCLPAPHSQLFLYFLKMTLTCPLPEDQNTRGRKLYPPELATQGFGILLSKEVPPIPAFPIYTRCGEVHVELIRLTTEVLAVSVSQFKKLESFHHYTFTSVLRLDKYLTLFDPEASENSYFVVPLIRTGDNDTVTMDWSFVETIWTAKDIQRPAPVTNEDRKGYLFRREDYVNAVVTPWYRNNDQPQFFYVAEICPNLTPMSQFPGCEFKTFEEYYHRKYNLKINDPSQPLLDVDHTSARLNFLTPRYVNRKGLPLPTSSEATKRAKRENLEQKQILVPELCAVHPFSGSLWRQAVTLPCILYRINSLLLANSIRTLVATQVRGLGVVTVPPGHQWPSMSFGWSMQELFGIEQPKPAPVTKPVPKSKPTGRKSGKNRLAHEITSEKHLNGDAYPTIPLGSPKLEEDLSGFEKAAKEATPAGVTLAESLLLNDKKHVGKSLNEILNEKMKKCRQPELEIGTWTNDMAAGGTYSEPEYDEDEDELLDPNVALPSNLMMLDKNWTWGGRSKLFNHRVHRALYGSPTHWGEVWDRGAFEPPEDLDNPKLSSGRADDDNVSVTSDLSGSDESYLDGDNNLKIQFEGNTAEATDKRRGDRGGFGDRTVEDWSASSTEDQWWTVDETEQSFGTTFEQEQELRASFEQRVDEKMASIQTIVNWDQIREIPPRSKKFPVNDVETAVETDDPLVLDQLLSRTQLLAPPEVKSLKLDRDADNSLTSLATWMMNGEDYFSFDYSPPLHQHCGPSPSQILQAMTMSNANDGQNLERLETIGDSFLKYAITSYLFCTYENIHEGKLSHLRSKQVSNIHLYRLGRRRGLGGVMVSAKFEPHDNWLPPCYHIPKDLDKAFISQMESGSGNFSMAQVNALKGLSPQEIHLALKNQTVKPDSEFIPYNLVTQQSIPDKSIADCVEALIGAYLTSAGPQGALLFMSWLGMRVLPSNVKKRTEIGPDTVGVYMEVLNADEVIVFGNLKPPKSPLLRYHVECEVQLGMLLKGYDRFEEYIGYRFRDKSYLLQAFTHASYATNTLTDCYQRLEFLGDAILDYVITRHLYEDKRQHSPGSLTDLRSALVNNTIFASLAVKHGFHLYFRHASPGLTTVLQKFVIFQEEHAHTLTPDYYLMGEEECDEAEDIEVPKALGDVFESVAGAIFLDSGMSLDAVWGVYYKIMKEEIEQFSQNVPKSPIRELLELEPETAKFSKPEKLWDGRRVRVSVEIIGVGVFRGIGRNYRIAKCTAAKCALRHLRRLKTRGGT